LPLHAIDKPLWVYANVTYPLATPVSGAGYYYAPYTAHWFTISSLLQTARPVVLAAAGVRPTLKHSLLIEDFKGDWEKEWFTYKPNEWARSTHKIGAPAYAAPDGAKLQLDVRAPQPNSLVVMLENYATVVNLRGGRWQTVTLQPRDFRDAGGHAMVDWQTARRLTLAPMERLRPQRGDTTPARSVGKQWVGTPPQFRNLHWQVAP